MNFQYPALMEKHIKMVLAGEYEISLPSARVVLDLGANVGSFALWASKKWPGCTIHCYEPSAFNFEILVKNSEQYENCLIRCNRQAVGNPNLNRLFQGKNNQGECSLFKRDEQTDSFEEIATIHPSSLPDADVLKMDIEGSETYVLEELSKSGRLNFSAILLEYHGEDTRRRIDELLKDYILVGGQIYGPHRGVLKYLKRQSP